MAIDYETVTWFLFFVFCLFFYFYFFTIFFIAFLDSQMILWIWYKWNLNLRKNNFAKCKCNIFYINNNNISVSAGREEKHERKEQKERNQIHKNMKDSRYTNTSSYNIHKLWAMSYELFKYVNCIHYEDDHGSILYKGSDGHCIQLKCIQNSHSHCIQ